MRFTIACIGRMKAGAEKQLCDRYIERAVKTGRSVGITAVTVSEHAESRQQRVPDRKSDEAQVMLSGLTPGAKLVVLDEAGRGMSSSEFCNMLARWRDDGIPEVVFAIGGADGHGEAVLTRANKRLALGPMTWPHQIARVLLAEQIYRATTILTGHPYHRE
ncbi:23S rRNA (pseudouridine1915-N3)-methyltransferase [Roseibium hamelinense]|uniref:Ribosomal RNA large subunit methyltransferase H n=1 Tax=Roseibium hamelinense TaxID=150831 RepID=A0A562T230_9HYPH|nr:23S rRNA (pseudouridine(1915)-N(3))-methyltransferase RlmH [Roseibium hamelinense]MTI43786.1 23S rRNA (pseudouridine(1915)-N(3))-methyltransferase RlmH [Roseibium hamelinense]TWI87134.1 23S rRNA (pseudouridine1915-N3)-methyltransferase [Roseibium hamelinense]